MRYRSVRPAIFASLLAITGCASTKPPQISYDETVPPLPVFSAPAEDPPPRPLHVPPAWTPARGGPGDARDPVARGGRQWRRAG